MKKLEALLHATSELEALLGDRRESTEEAETLLQHCLGGGKVQIYMEPQNPLKQDEESRFRQCLNRRLTLEPVAYILGRREFFGLEFVVDPSVLIPRPESELLVEVVVGHILKRYGKTDASLLIADTGTGSGCLAVALATSLPHCKVVAIDISREALGTAQKNVLRHNLCSRVELIQGDLLSACDIEKLDIIVANLPYIPFAEYKELSRNMLKYEPAVSLAGGHDGLFYIRELLTQTSDKLTKGGSLFLEVGMGQAPLVADMAWKSFGRAQVETYKDLSGVERVVKVCW